MHLIASFLSTFDQFLVVFRQTAVVVHLKKILQMIKFLILIQWIFLSKLFRISKIESKIIYPNQPSKFS